MYSKKDFQLVASIIKEARELQQDGVIDDVEGCLNWLAARFAAEFGSTNPRFNCSKFIEACK